MSVITYRYVLGQSSAQIDSDDAEYAAAFAASVLGEGATLASATPVAHIATIPAQPEFLSLVVV
jgi:hypothetical protein